MNLARCFVAFVCRAHVKKCFCRYKRLARQWWAYWQPNSCFFFLGQLHTVSDFIYVLNIKSTSRNSYTTGSHFSLLGNYTCYYRTNAGLNNAYSPSSLKTSFVFNAILHSCEYHMEKFDRKVLLAWCFIAFITFTNTISYYFPNACLLWILTYLTFTCSKPTIETLEKV